MKVALILPKYSVSINDPCCFPLGFMTISAVLKHKGHDVKVLNFNLVDYDVETELQGMGAVLFTGFEEFTEFNKTISAYCKTQGIRTVLGGAVATFSASEMIRYFDSVVIGEGENVICDALCSSGIFKGTKPDINKLTLPDYEGFGINDYNFLHQVKYMGVLTSRGCPYNCKFCVQTCSFQFRSLLSVFNEIDLYRVKYGVTHIVFNDNTLNLRKDRFMVICEGMKERGLSWTAAIRADVFDEEMAVSSKESGCSWFVVGVESFSDTKLVEMNKRVTRQQITNTLDLLNKYKIGYHGNILLGFPTESYSDIVDELQSMPTIYNVFPVLVQSFIGTGYRERSISEEDEQRLSAHFKHFAESQGMAMYREAA